MGYTSTAEEALEILTFLDEVGAHDALWWRCDGAYAPITFFVPCNDLFTWATAEAEELTVADLPALRQAIADVREIDEFDIGRGFALWACRKVGMRPQQPAYPKDERLRALFDAAGPVRDPKTEG